MCQQIFGHKLQLWVLVQVLNPLELVLNTILVLYASILMQVESYSFIFKLI